MSRNDVDAVEDGDLAIERDIRQFVATKTGERVYLYLGETASVSIRHIRKSGSTILAIFWLKVLQHQNNYPLKQFPYRKLYHGGRLGEERVVLSVDGVKVIVFMKSGTMQVTGTHAVEWFVDRFRGIMAAYMSPPGEPQPLRDIFTRYQTDCIVKEKQRAKQSYHDLWPDEALRESVNVMQEGQQLSEKITRTAFPQLPDMLSDEHVYICSDPDILPSEELSAQTERLTAGTMLQGHVLYRLWKSLLNSWFADDGSVVYIITPRLDVDRLANICRLYLNNRLTATLGALCVPIQFQDTRMADVKRDAMRQFQAKDQVIIEYNVYEGMVYPQKHYQAKFIACVKNETASILLTTADFHGDHFLQSCTDSAVFLVLPESDFARRYLGPILASAH